MRQVYVSRLINYYLFMGHPDQMLSSRIHAECWRIEPLVDLIFFWHHHHCERAYCWEQQELHKGRNGC